MFAQVPPGGSRSAALRASLSSFSLFVGRPRFARFFPAPRHVSSCPRALCFSLFPRWRSFFALVVAAVACGWPVRVVVWPGFPLLLSLSVLVGVPPFVGWPGVPSRSFLVSGGR
jgi:hypothetical protein